jgi:hypothetical protein
MKHRPGYIGLAGEDLRAGELIRPVITKVHGPVTEFRVISVSNDLVLVVNGAGQLFRCAHPGTDVAVGDCVDVEWAHEG